MLESKQFTEQRQITIDEQHYGYVGYETDENGKIISTGYSKIEDILMELSNQFSNDIEYLLVGDEKENNGKLQSFDISISIEVKQTERKE